MKRKLLFILLVAGLVAGKALLADKPSLTEAAKHLKPFNCENSIEGELLVQLRVNELNSNKQLRLNQDNQFEVATFTKSGDQVIEQQNTPQTNLQRAFVDNNFEVTSVEPIQAMFKGGENFGKSPEGATGIMPEVKSQITKISFKQIQRTKRGEEVLAYPTKTATKDFIKQLKKALAQEVKFVSEVCQNVEPTAVPPFPWPDDPVLAQDQWGLFNFGAQGGLPDVDVNYIPAWQRLSPIWQLYPTDQIVMSVIGAGLDDRPASPTFQNSDLENVVGGSYVVPDIGGGNYYDYLTETHELEVSGIAVAGNNNGKGITGLTRGKIFLSVFNDGGILTNANFIDAIDQASLNSEIINASYGIIGNDPAIVAILETIASRGDIAVFGAGNAGEDLDNPSPAYNGGYPCRYNKIPGININIICVAGIDIFGNIDTFLTGETSNYGKTKVQVAAPSEGINTTTAGDTWGANSGTSYATPFVSSLVSIVRWMRPLMSLAQIKALILDPNNRRLLPTPPPPPPSTPPLLDAISSGGVPDFNKVLQAAVDLAPLLCGDADGDLRITVLDALVTARESAGISSVRNRMQADINGDSRISTLDALQIARFVVGFPVVQSCPGM